jgi:hypothetical protein
MFGAVLSAAGLLLTVAPGVAAAADAQKAPGLIAKASVSSSQGLTAQAGQIPDRVTALCIPGVSGHNRFFNCIPSVGEVVFFIIENGVPKRVGDITFRIEQTDELAVKSTTVTETVYIYDIRKSGRTAPDGLALVVNSPQSGGGSVTELDAATGALAQVLDGPAYRFSSPEGIASDGARVWVANFSGYSVTEFPASPNNARPIRKHRRISSAEASSAPMPAPQPTSSPAKPAKAQRLATGSPGGLAPGPVCP